MRIIITGGTGLIGKPLTSALVEKGHDVIVLSRKAVQVTNSGPRVRFVQWDGKSAAGWAELADGAGAIINLAGESLAGDSLLRIRWTEERKRSIRQSRIDAGKAVLEATSLANNKPGLIIQASAVGFYGPRDHQKFDETAQAGNDYLAEVCKEWEAATQAVELMGVRRVVIRSGVVLSAQGGALPRQIIPFRFFAGGPIGSGKQGYPWIHIADVVGSILFLVENPASHGVYNLTAPNPVTNAEFGRELGKVLGRPAFLPAPSFVFKLVFGEASTILLDGQMPIPTRLTNLGYKFQFTDLRAALENLLNK